MKFCEICKAKLNKLTPDEIVFECTACKQIYPSTADDTLMYERSYKINEDEAQYKFLRNAAFMDDNLKEKKLCKACGKKYVRIAIIGDDMIKHFICKCGVIWTE